MKFLFLAGAIASFTVFASYRVFRLKVVHYDPKGKIIHTETVLSRFDPIQYEHYHSGFRRDRVEMLETWWCPGDTHGKPFCKKPKVREVGFTADSERRFEIPK